MRIPFRGLGLLARLFVFFVVLLGGPRIAAAFAPPSPQGAVTDTSGHLTADDDKMLEAELAAYRARTTNEIGVLMVGSLGGESIDDVAYTTFNTWGVGKKGPDNGVLLVIAPNERKMRIETGKGVGDRLTDLQSSRILRERVGPMLKENRFKDAILAGVQAIEAALDDGASSPPSAVPAAKKQSAPVSVFGLVFAVIVVVGVIGLFGLVVSLIARALRSPRRGGSSYSSSGGGSDWSSGSSGGSDWSSGSSGGSDYGGSSGGGSDFGGGSSGGGGSSDSY